MTGTIPELLDTIEKTRDARFNCSRRLANHQRVSQWSISMISAVLIVLPQINFTGEESKLWNIAQSVIALILLVYSLILPAENYQHRALRMHECGLALGRLVSKIKYNNLTIDVASNEYQNILSNYDNHEEIDYLPIKVKGQIKSSLKGLGLNLKTILLPWKYIVYYIVTPLRIIFGYIYYFPLIVVGLWLIVRFLPSILGLKDVVPNPTGQ